MEQWEKSIRISLFDGQCFENFRSDFVQISLIFRNCFPKFCKMICQRSILSEVIYIVIPEKPIHITSSNRGLFFPISQHKFCEIILSVQIFIRQRFVIIVMDKKWSIIAPAVIFIDFMPAERNETKRILFPDEICNPAIFVFRFQAESGKSTEYSSPS